MDTDPPPDFAVLDQNAQLSAESFARSLLDLSEPVSCEHVQQLADLLLEGNAGSG